MLELLDLRERGERLDATRLEIDPTVADTVSGILQRVFVEGDDVLIELAHRFDGADLSGGGVLVTDEEFDAAERGHRPELEGRARRPDRAAGDLAVRQLPREWWDERDGVRFGEIVRPLQSVGCYVPGGRARLPVVGVHDRRAGGGRRRRRDRALHAAAVRRLDPPGRALRGAEGRRALRGEDRRRPGGRGHGLRHRVDPAGRPHRRPRATPTSPRPSARSPARRHRRSRRPSELAIVADGDVDIDMAALDLIAQAEHDPEARTFFITPDPDLVDRVAKALDEELEDAGRREIVDAALDYTKAVLVRDLDQAAEVVNDLAFEHVQLLLPEPEASCPRCGTPARSSSGDGPRCRSATTGSPRTTCCPPPARRASRAGCARRTTSR